MGRAERPSPVAVTVKRGAPHPRAMRPLASLILVLALVATSGCFGGGDGGDAESNGTPTTTPGPTPTLSTPAATPEATPSTPEAGTPSPTPPTQPPAPAAPPRKEIYNATFDFASQGDATGQSPKTQQTTSPEAGHTVVFVNITLARSSPTPGTIPVSGTLNSPAVRILKPDGTEAFVATEEGVAQAQVEAVPGTWSVRYEGAGTLRAAVSLVAV